MKLFEILKKIIAKIGSGEKLTEEEKLEMERALDEENKKTESEEPDKRKDEKLDFQLPPKSVEELKTIVDAQSKKINELMTILQAEQSQREQSRLALENEAKTKRAGEIKELIEKAVKSTYLAPADETGKKSWQNLLESNYENASKLLQTHIETAEKKAKPPESSKGESHKSAESFTKLGSNLLPGLKEYISN